MAGLPTLDYRPTVSAVLRRAAERFGDGDYVVMPDARISFREAEASSRLLAKQLLNAGVVKGSRVGIHLATGPSWTVAFLAATRIGALAMPFSTIYRPEELRTALRIGDVSLLISSPAMLGKDHEAFLEAAIPGLAGSEPGRYRNTDLPYFRSVVVVGETTRAWAAPLDTGGFDDSFLEAVEEQVTPADELVAVFTSGTTAAPKAVVHTHGAAVRKTSPEADAALNAIFPGRGLSLMPFFWIGGLQEVLSALQSGATLLCLERLDGKAAIELGRKEQATSIIGNPQALRAALGDQQLSDVIPSLEPNPPRPWVGGPSSRGDMATGIGMTETFGAWANIGFDVRIIDPETHLEVAEGEIGEFFVRGYSLMERLHRWEREEVFTPDGFYATGDLGYVEGGKYYFTARLKELIKTKGANVAPAEVEAVLEGAAEVRMSFVVGVPHLRFGEEVVAGVVPEEGPDGVPMAVDVDALRAACKERVSSYKVPAAIYVLARDEIPHLASSKPDRRAVGRLLVERHAGA